MTRSINPIKMMEYLAPASPSVSTPLPAAERFLGPVAIASNAENRPCLRRRPRAQNTQRERISQAIRDHTWNPA